MTQHPPSAPGRDAVTKGPAQCLIVPGLNGSGPDHWQTRWQHCRDDCVRVDLGDWDSPTRAGWVAAIDAAVARTDTAVVLIGHSLGCLAIVWWAAQAGSSSLAKIRGVMLVAPPDMGQQGCDLRLLRFAPLPPGPLPFPTLVVASADDPYASLTRSRDLAQELGAGFADVGHVGHINAASGIGDWPEGQALLASLIERTTA